jgi:hypothetical protein
MKRKYFIFIIALVALVFTGFLSGNVYALGHYGVPGTVDGCFTCHDFMNGYYDTSGYNLRWVRSSIEWPTGTVHPTVYFRIFEDTDGTLADGNDNKLDGPCEVCHTSTLYHTNTGDGTIHFDHQNCLQCHPHFSETAVNYFEPIIKGPQSHRTHWTDPKGPQLGEDNCTACHYPSDYTKFGPSGDSFEDTDVCDACHSPNGFFDGVNDPTVGAKANWENGIYEPPADPNAWPSRLRTGKENWCAGCHDNGTSTVKGIDAPNVMGNNTSYGYNVNGHGNKGILCADCHKLTVLHTDGRQRTYVAGSTNPAKSYRNGYRLNEDMAVPRIGEVYPAAFRLCTNCHVYTDIIGPNSNFRDEGKGLQLHKMHLEEWPAFICSDSDFDGVGCSSGTCKDSAITCIICHNVHGAKGNKVMIRHGELISSPGSTDKVPALDFKWYKADKTTPTTVIEESLYGGLLCGIQPNIAFNHVCAGCHPTGEMKWYRTPGGPFGITIEAVWTSDPSDTYNTPITSFSPGHDVIKYNVRFKIAGTSTYYLKSLGTAKNTSGAAWETPLDPIKEYLPAATYERSWVEDIPGTADLGSSAKVVITIKMLTAPGGTLLDQETKKAFFDIVAP